jgi:hypothetical protein
LVELLLRVLIFANDDPLAPPPLINRLSCTMVITDPSKFIAQVHDRMPSPRDEALRPVEAGRYDGRRCADEAGRPGALQQWPVSNC